MESVFIRWRDLGLRILPHGDNPLAISASAGLAFGVFMALADATLFRGVIPTVQADLVSRLTAYERVAYFAPFSIADELIFRLVVMSALVWMLTAIAGLRAWCFWAAILVTALLIYPMSHQAYLSGLVLTPLTVLREIALHGGAGVLWGYLYWRHGLIAAIVGHVSAHISMEPLLSFI